jgi:glutaminase
MALHPALRADLSPQKRDEVRKPVRPDMPYPAPDLETVVREIADEMAARTDRGEVASYIPELAGIDSKQFGLVVVDAEGRVAAAGDADVSFSIQSISKVFTLTLALGMVGDRLWRHVGREPSGNPFNSIVQLERERGVPRNPFINAGAIAVTDVILSGHQPREAIGEILRFMQFLAGDPSIVIDEKVAASEKRTGFRNTALANYMKSFGVIENPVDFTLGVYFHHCAIAMTCRQLAMAGRFLAWSGRNPSTGLSVVSPERARRINALMLTCGHYDGSGEFAYRVGLPGKSGVGGGILTVAPGKASIAVWAPGLDKAGNSHLGRIALEALTKRMGWSIFGV